MSHDPSRRVLAAAAAAAVVPRAAATTLVVRDAAPGLEVLMLRRSLQASFMPGAYVFPGGAVDAADGAPDSAAACDETPAQLARRIGAVTEVGDAALAHAVAALRECFEECGLWLGAPALPDAAALRARLHGGETLASLAAAAQLRLATSVLQPWGRWVTPFGLPKRFDTLFLVAAAPAQQSPSVDAGETTTLAWVHPEAALEAHGRGEFPMEFATVRTVESLRPFGSVRAVLDAAAARASLPPLHPRLVLDGDGAIRAVLLPHEPGYAEAYALR